MVTWLSLMVSITAAIASAKTLAAKPVRIVRTGVPFNCSVGQYWNTDTRDCETCLPLSLFQQSLAHKDACDQPVVKTACGPWWAVQAASTAPPVTTTAEDSVTTDLMMPSTPATSTSKSSLSTPSMADLLSAIDSRLANLEKLETEKQEKKFTLSLILVLVLGFGSLIVSLLLAVIVLQFYFNCKGKSQNVTRQEQTAFQFGSCNIGSSNSVPRRSRTVSSSSKTPEHELEAMIRQDTAQAVHTDCGGDGGYDASSASMEKKAGHESIIESMV